MYLNAWPGDEEDGKQRTATEHHYWVTLEREGMRNVDDTPNKCPQRTEPKEGDTEVTQKGQKKLLVSKPLEVKSLESTGYSKEQSDQKKQGQSYFWGATTEEEVTDGGEKAKDRRLRAEQRETVHLAKEAAVLLKIQKGLLWGHSVLFLRTGPLTEQGIIRKFCSGTPNQSCKAQLPFWEQFFPSFGDSWMNIRRVHCHLYYSLAVKPVKMTFFFLCYISGKMGKALLYVIGSRTFFSLCPARFV